MANVLRNIELKLNASVEYQKIDGFGVNINSQYWDGGGLIPAMELLLDNLGATLFRVDIFGKSNWIDPECKIGASALNEENYEKIYTSKIFKNGWAMIRYLNERGIEPYLTCSGDVPQWMLGEDGKTLVQYDQFCDMLISLIDWARNKEGLKFKYFGPLNETDIGSPEGPTALPEAYTAILELLNEKLIQKGFDDLRLVVAEQSQLNADYVKEFVKNDKLINRIGVFGLHTYSDYSFKTYTDIVNVKKNTQYSDHSMWMSEYGDLDQSGEKEWYVAWKSTCRLMDSLEAGFNGALAWDAYDNFHDHDDAWTIYGLLRNARRIYTPKKRFYSAKQIYRYVKPDFKRIETLYDCDDLRILAFSNDDRTKFTIVGMNTSCQDCYITIRLDGFDETVEKGKVSYYRTSENENCAKVEELDFICRFDAGMTTGIEVIVPAYSIFTLTNI